MDYHYNGAWRMDWGFGNPNGTAVLIACLMLAVWAVSPVWKGGGYWLALGVTTAFAACLVETYSRGGMVAFLCGAAILISLAPRPWPKAKWVGATIALWIFVAFIFAAKAQARYGQGIFSQDESIESRFVIWHHVPEMIAAAPWGWRNPGDAYTQWFQPPSQSVSYTNLLNSHFNFMAESGWIGAVLYLFAWWLVLLLCWPSGQFSIRPIAFAVWVAFGVGACFSHVGQWLFLWMVPLVMLAGVLVERFRAARWLHAWHVYAGGVVSVAGVAGLIGVGFATATLPVRCEQGAVVIGERPKATVVFVDRKVMGSLYGHVFRKFLAAHPDAVGDRRFIFAESARPGLASAATQVVLSGRFADDGVLTAQMNPASLVLVNPSACLEPDWPNREFRGRLTVYFGEYSQSAARSSWPSYRGTKPIQIEGAADFVPRWPEAIWAGPKS